MSKLIIRLAAAGFAIAALHSTAFASDLPSVPVPYSDLDLGSSAGVASLNGRIQRAAVRLCTGHLRTGPRFWSKFDFQDCVEQVIAGARPAVTQAVSRATATQLARRGR